MADLQLVLRCVVVTALGGVIGTAELVGRYRDSPGAALRTLPALFYMIINMMASAGAYALANIFKWSFTLGKANDQA